jgi:hypothetical protein
MSNDKCDFCGQLEPDVHDQELWACDCEDSRKDEERKGRVDLFF